jgi:hypothetical protein
MDINFKIIPPKDIHNQIGSYSSALKSKKVHIIAVAKTDGIGKTLLLNLGEQDHMINSYCEKVNSKYEPGCLYPKLTFTIFPIFKEERRSSMESDLAKFFGDTFEAQEKYFQCDEMIYLFDQDTWPDFSLLEQILRQELLNRPAQIRNYQVALSTNL